MCYFSHTNGKYPFPRTHRTSRTAARFLFAKGPTLAPSLPRVLRSLLTRMLNLDPYKRLGGSRSGAYQIFRDIDFGTQYRTLAGLQEVRASIKANAFPDFAQVIASRTLCKLPA